MNFKRFILLTLFLFCIPVLRAFAADTLVIDNTDPGFSTDAPWVQSQCANGYYGKNYVHSGSALAQPGKWAKWAPNFKERGSYHVYLYWTSCQKRSKNVPVEVSHAGGLDATQYIDQTKYNGQWVYIGTYDFAPNSGHYVKIEAKNNGYTIADAVKFEPASAPVPPDVPKSEPLQLAERFPVYQKSINHAMGGNIRGFGMLAQYTASPSEVLLKRTTSPAASEAYPPICTARIYAPDGTLLAYADFSAQSESSDTRIISLPEGEAGIYRVSFSGGRTGDILEIGLPQTDIWGVRGEMALGLSETIPNPGYIYTTKTTALSEEEAHRNMLPSGFFTIEGYKNAQATLYAENGGTLGTLQKTGIRSMLTIENVPCGEIWKLSTNRADAIAIDGVAGLICPSPEAACALKGGTVETADGFCFAGPLQARLHEKMLALRDGLDVQAEYPAANNINWELIQNPQNELLLYGKYSVLSSLDALLAAQQTDPTSPRFGQLISSDNNRSTSLLAGAATTPGLLNPVYGNPALIRRAALSSMAELVWVQGDGLPRTADLRTTTYPCEGIIFSYNALIAETCYLLRNSSAIDTETRDIWKQNLMAVADKLADFQGYQSNQWAFMMLGHLHTYLATGEQRFLEYFERQMEAYLTNAHGANSKFGLHETGFYMEEGGPDGNYDSLNAFNTGAAYNLYKTLPESNPALVALMRASIEKNLAFKSKFWLVQPDGTLFAPNAFNCRTDTLISTANYPGDYLTRSESGLSLRRFLLNQPSANGVSPADTQSHVANSDAWAVNTLIKVLPQNGAMDASIKDKGVWLPAISRAYRQPITAAPAALPSETDGITETPGLITFRRGKLYGAVFYDVAGSTKTLKGKFGGAPSAIWSPELGTVLSSMRNTKSGAVTDTSDITNACVFGTKADGTLFVSGNEHTTCTWTVPQEAFALTAPLTDIDGTLRWTYELHDSEIAVTVSLDTNAALSDAYINLPVLFRSKTAYDTLSAGVYRFYDNGAQMQITWPSSVQASLATGLSAGGTTAKLSALRIPLDPNGAPLTFHIQIK